MSDTIAELKHLASQNAPARDSLSGALRDVLAHQERIKAELDRLIAELGRLRAQM
jgi:hypothetical protein